MKISQGIIVLILLAFLAGSVIAVAGAASPQAAPLAKPTVKATPGPVKPGNYTRSYLPAPFVTQPSTYPYNYPPPRNRAIPGSTGAKYLQLRLLWTGTPGTVLSVNPAQRYGIYGLGNPVPYVKARATPTPNSRTSTVGSSGMVPLNSHLRYAGRGPGLINGVAFPTPSPPRPAAAAPRPVVSINPKASPTPVPGGYTPRFPGEQGYNRTANPAPTVMATPPPGGYTPRFPGEQGYKGSPTPTVKPTPTVRR
jgi:hypothetical protein